MGVMGGSVKLGRNKKKCVNYFLMMRRVTNKQRKLIKHVSNHENDLDAKKSLKSIKNLKQ